MDIVRALEVYNRTVSGQWTVGEDYSSLIWEGEDKPTEEQLIECWDLYVQERERNRYKELRAKEYPSIVDQLDLIYHLGIDGWKAEIKKVKDKYPKPE